MKEKEEFTKDLLKIGRERAHERKSKRKWKRKSPEPLQGSKRDVEEFLFLFVNLSSNGYTTSLNL